MRNQNLAHTVFDLCRERKLRLASAESCTGGLIAAAITDIAGSSEVFLGSIVAYDNSVKQKLLNVAPALLESAGAVSWQVACTMAEGALAALDADIAVSVTGIAGPGGGSLQKPVGLVYIALAMQKRETLCQEWQFGDVGREAVREKTVTAALVMIADFLRNEKPVA
jgi:nicotinamide-nucleotide amidase